MKLKTIGGGIHVPWTLFLVHIHLVMMLLIFAILLIQCILLELFAQHGVLVLSTSFITRWFVCFFKKEIFKILKSVLKLQIKELISQNQDLVGKSLLKVRLSDKQWEQIHGINVTLSEEYKTRREMLLKRLDVTVQSFMWSDKAKVRILRAA